VPDAAQQTQLRERLLQQRERRRAGAVLGEHLLRVPRHVDDLLRGRVSVNLFAKRPPRHTRHHHVDEEQVERFRALPPQFERRFTAIDRCDPIP